MKRIRIIALIFLYALASSGVQVRAHWCGGELTAVEWFCTEGHHDCGCSHGTDDLGDCCREVACRVQGQSHQTVTQLEQAAKAQAVIAVKPKLPAVLFPEAQLLLSRVNVTLLARASTEPEDVPIHIRNQVFRT